MEKYGSSRMAFIAILIVLIIIATMAGCMRQSEVCNYDAVCTDEETDDCADCKNVVGRDINLNTPLTDGNVGDSP